MQFCRYAAAELDCLTLEQRSNLIEILLTAAKRDRAKPGSEINGAISR